MRHREKLRRLDPDIEQTRTLQFLVEARRKFVSDKARCSNRLTAYLKMYFPQILDWFTEITSPIAGEFLERWPSLQKVQKARPETLRKFFIQRHSCKLDNIDRRLEEIRRAMPATHDPAVTCSCSAAVLALVRMVRAVRDANETSTPCRGKNAFSDSLLPPKGGHDRGRVFDACRHGGVLVSAYPREVDALNKLVDELYRPKRL